MKLKDFQKKLNHSLDAESLELYIQTLTLFERRFHEKRLLSKIRKRTI